MEKKIKSNYYTAIHWLNNSFVLCNNIPEIDNTIWNNMRWDYYNEEDDSYEEIYQWFITDCSESDVEYLEEHFTGVNFTYSELLDCFILCVTHYGTMWKGVPSYTDLEYAKRDDE